MGKGNPEYGGFDVKWCPEDIQAVRPKWSKKRCAAEMELIERHAKDRMIELGWDVLDCLLPPATPPKKRG